MGHATDSNVPQILAVVAVIVIVAVAILVDGCWHCCRLLGLDLSNETTQTASQVLSLVWSHLTPIYVELLHLTRVRTLHSFS